MNIGLKDRLRLAVNFFRAMDNRNQNIVAVVCEGSGDAIISTDLSEGFVDEFKQLFADREQRGRTNA